LREAWKVGDEYVDKQVWAILHSEFVLRGSH
jgi:hypothetical protein